MYATLAQLRLEGVQRFDASSAFEAIGIEMELDTSVLRFLDVDVQGLASALADRGDDSLTGQTRWGETDCPARFRYERDELCLEADLAGGDQIVSNRSDASLIVTGDKRLQL